MKAAEVRDTVRRLWDVDELARRQDGTFVLSERTAKETRQAVRELDEAVKRVAERARRTSHQTEVRVRRVDPEQRGWQAVQGRGRPLCKGAKQNPPGKGRPCRRRALADSDCCYSHDPRRALEPWGGQRADARPRPDDSRRQASSRPRESPTR